MKRLITLYTKIEGACVPLPQAKIDTIVERIRNGEKVKLGLLREQV
jgi:hypothetical protein